MSYNEIIESTVITRGGRNYLIELTPDQESGHPRDEGDCYTQEDFDAWENNEWGWVNVDVTPLDEHGDEMRHATDSLGSVEYGSNPGWVSEHNPHGIVDMDRIIADHVDHGDMWGTARDNLKRDIA